MTQIRYRVSVPLDGKRVTRKFKTRSEVADFTRGHDAKDVRLFYDARVRDGDKEHSASFKRRKDADLWIAEKEIEKARGMVIAPGRTRLPFGVAAKRWQASNPTKRPTTLAVEADALRLHILPRFEKLSLAKIQPADVQAAVNSWSDQLGPRTVRRTYDVLRAILAYAVENDLIARTPCRGINLPRVIDRVRQAIGADEVAALAAAVGVEYACAVYLAAVLGLRWSEVAGLKVGAVDLNAGTVAIREVRVRTAHHDQVTGPPKSDAGRRTLSMPESLTNLLKAHLERRGKVGPASYVFINSAGGPLDYVNWRRRVWLPACITAGVEGIGFHDLRRTAVTALVLGGVDLKTAQTRIGHSDIRLTLQTYAQASSAADRAAATTLGAHFFGEAAPEAVG